MNEVLMAIAKTLPKEIQIKMLTDVLEEYKAKPTPESWTRVAMFCTMVSMHYGTEGKDLNTVLKDMKEVERMSSAMNFNKQ